jgi:hypothetical protein
MRISHVSRALPLAAVLAGLTFTGTASAAGRVEVECRGSEQSCVATVSLAGGASNKKVLVELPGTNLKRVHVSVSPAWAHGAYSLSKGTYSLGGSLYTTTLNAVESLPKGAKLRIEFAQPTHGLDCGGIYSGVGYLTTAITVGEANAGAFGCPQAVRVARQWLKQFNAGKSTRTVKANTITYTCKVVPRIPQNIACTGDGTVVRFAGPTGR